MDLCIIDPRKAQPAHAPSLELFTAHTMVHRISEALGTDTVSVNVLYFDPGARSRPHAHDSDQILYYYDGAGVVAVDGGADRLVQPGEFVMLPANVVHMHGAAPGVSASHISLMPIQHTTDFSCPLPAAWAHWRP